MLYYSLAELIDRLGITHNKLFHIEEQIEKGKKENWSEEKIVPLLDQVVSLNKLRVDIVESINELFERSKEKSDD